MGAASGWRRWVQCQGDRGDRSVRVGTVAAAPGRRGVASIGDNVEISLPKPNPVLIGEIVKHLEPCCKMNSSTMTGPTRERGFA